MALIFKTFKNQVFEVAKPFLIIYWGASTASIG